MPACPAGADGTLRLSSESVSLKRPPAIAVNGEIWPFVGTENDPGTADARVAWYAKTVSGGARFLSIADDGTVTLMDLPTQTNATGTYSFVTHLFQTEAGQLPTPLYGTKGYNGNNDRWEWLEPGGGQPSTLLVGGDVWGFTGSDAEGTHYAGYYTGQQITIGAAGIGGARTVTLADGAGTSTGTFVRGGFLMNGGPSVTPGGLDGTATGPTDGLVRLAGSMADLDIAGNVFTLGSWRQETTHAGMALQYSEPAGDPLVQKALIYLTGSRADTSFLWTRAATDGGSTFIRMMMLGGDHALSLYAPTSSTVPAIVFNPDPAVGSRVNGPLRVAPAGDLLMGGFTTGPKPDGSN